MALWFDSCIDNNTAEAPVKFEGDNHFVLPTSRLWRFLRYYRKTVIPTWRHCCHRDPGRYWAILNRMNCLEGKCIFPPFLPASICDMAGIIHAKTCDEQYSRQAFVILWCDVCLSWYCICAVHEYLLSNVFFAYIVLSIHIANVHGPMFYCKEHWPCLCL